MTSVTDITRNVALYPWHRFARSLIFWQAVWFLYFQSKLSAAEAILLYVVYDIATTALEVPSGWLSDRIGRRITLILSAGAEVAGAALLAMGDSFAAFALAQALIGAGAAFASGTDSALLYESLSADGRDDEIERQELRAWRFSFSALAISAVAGGAMALIDPVLPFAAGVVTAIGLFAITLMLREPPHSAGPAVERLHLQALRETLRHPVLVWLFALSVLMYAFSHVPFVFGQPFILQALDGVGLDGQAPIVSGLVTAVMMALSLATSHLAPWLKLRLGLGGLLLLAFAMQIGLIAVLAATSSLVAIAFLFLRMVPDALSKPFITARMQPLLQDQLRATYASLQSFVGRLLFAGTLMLAALASPAERELAHSELRWVLTAYAFVGLSALAALWMAKRRVALEADP